MEEKSIDFWYYIGILDTILLFKQMIIVDK